MVVYRIFVFLSLSSYNDQWMTCAQTMNRLYLWRQQKSFLSPSIKLKYKMNTKLWFPLKVLASWIASHQMSKNNIEENKVGFTEYSLLWTTGSLVIRVFKLEISTLMKCTWDNSRVDGSQHSRIYVIIISRNV